MNLLAAFFLGFAGSLHCAVMCGPLVVAVHMGRRQIHQAAYHFGRIVVYGVLGGVSGLIGAAVLLGGFQRGLSIAAGCLTLLALIVSFRAKSPGVVGRVVYAIKGKFGRLLRHRGLGGSVMLGGLNGLLPCGLIYVACAAAAAAGSVLGGVSTMLSFGLGTAPMLLTTGFTSRVVCWSHPLLMKRVVVVCTTGAGVLLIVRGLAGAHFPGALDPICGLRR